MSNQVIVTAEEAIKLINKRTGLKHIGYMVGVRPHLPIGDNKYFPGLALVRVSKAQFIRAIKDSLEYFEKRGAKIEMRVPTEDFDSFSIG